MSFWTDQWKSFIRETSYLHNLREEKISNDQFWRRYGIYDQALKHSGYPGEVLNRIISFINPARPSWTSEQARETLPSPFLI
jgi:hypothetical protein